MGVLALSAAVALVAILYAAYLIHRIHSLPIKSKKVRELHGYIREGAIAFMRRQYTVILSIVFAISVLLLALLGWRVFLAYVLGALASTAAGLAGMYTAVNTNARTVEILKKKDLRRGLIIAFNGGSVLGFLVVGLGVLGIALLSYLFGQEGVAAIVGFSFGASTVALFARVGGGIYTKAADVGADLVGKVEAGIPEDDPRNPGVIADNVGDNVGDCAGMGADLFESYVGSIVSAMLLGALVGSFAGQLVLLPVAVAALGILASLLSAQLLHVLKTAPDRALQAVALAAILLTAAFSYVYMVWTLPSSLTLPLWGAILLGLAAGAVVGFTSDYFTSKDRPPAQHVARMSEAGPALTILTGLSKGFMSVVLPSIFIGLASLFAYILGSSVAGFYGGLYAVALAAVGMLSVTGVIVAADAYGPIVDNAAGISEMAGMPEDVRELADTLDSAGNTMKSVSKGYAIGSAALTALALMFAFIGAAGIDPSSLRLLDARVVAGIFVGAALPALFTALVIAGVSDAAFAMVDEIRRQFREIKGLLEGKAKPDYARCVDIATRYSLRKLVLPGVLAIVAPLLVGLFLGPEALAGALLGAITVGLILGLFQGNVGNTWDNAKKYIELGAFGGKGSEAHKAAVVGDTVGDPLKDAAGPSINILIKLMSVVSVVFGGLIAALALL